MELLLVLTSLLAIQAGGVRRDIACAGPVINGVHYTKEVLKANILSPVFLSTDDSTDTLYFSYNANEVDAKYKSVKLNLKTKELTDILGDGVPDSFVQSVDKKTNDLYVAGSEGVFKYSKNNNKAEYLGANGTNIRMLYFKDILYFSELYTEFLYTIVDGEVARFKELENTKVKHLVIDNDDQMYFSNWTGFYSLQKGSKEAVHYNYTNLTISGLAIDKNNDVFASVLNGIYAVNKQKHNLERILKVRIALGVAFDSENNMIYSDPFSIFKLKPDDQDCRPSQK